MITKPNEKTLARSLYFETEQSHQQIADTVGINRKTLYLWMKEGEWQRLKRAARQAPAIVVDNLFEQLTELNNNILARPHGSRFPTREEAEISRKLILSIDKIKKHATLSDNIQVMTNFTNYLLGIDPALAKQVVIIADDFIRKRAQDGSAPYHMDYMDDQSDDYKKDASQPAAVIQEAKEQQPAAVTDMSPILVPEDITPTQAEQQQEEGAPHKYREGIEEIFEDNPLYSKTLKVGNITIRFGQHLSGPRVNNTTQR